MADSTYKPKHDKLKVKEKAQSYYGYERTAKILYENSKIGRRFKRIWHLVTTDDNIAQAYRSIKRNKGARTSGTDRKDIRTYENMKFGTLTETIRNKTKQYKPGAVRRKLIPKKKPGEFRPLGIPNTLDKIIQQAVRQILEPIFEAKFKTSSYGFRPARNQHQAIEHIQRLISKCQYTHAVEFDIRKYFDNIDHSILISIIRQNGIEDEKILQVVKAILKAPIKGEGTPTKGTPQGGVISPLLANIYLNELDKFIEKQYSHAPRKVKENRKKYKIRPVDIVRYADDFVIFTKSRKDAVYYERLVIEWLQEHKLEHAPEKTHIINMKRKAIVFLGIKIKASKSRDKKIKHLVAKSYIPKESVEKAIKKIKQTTRENRKAVILGYINYIAIATSVTRTVSILNYRLYKAKISKSTKRRKAPRYPTGNRPVVNSESLQISNVHYKQIQLPSQDSFYKNLTRLRDYPGLSEWFKEPNDPTEKYDIIRSLFVAQKGKDPITRERLINPHCHRKKPGNKGGTYSYGNCIAVQRETHTIIHGNWENLEAFCIDRKVRMKQILRIVELWKQAHK